MRMRLATRSPFELGRCQTQIAFAAIGVRSLSAKLHCLLHARCAAQVAPARRLAGFQNQPIRPHPLVVQHGHVAGAAVERRGNIGGCGRAEELDADRAELRVADVGEAMYVGPLGGAVVTHQPRGNVDVRGRLARHLVAQTRDAVTMRKA